MTQTPDRLPDFIIIGAAKSGTTTLFSYLDRHPHAFGSTPKEPCFFDAAVNWHRGTSWYRDLFAGAKDDQLCFEASTNYTRFPQVPDVPERIHDLVPNAKLVYVMRHPVDRAFSHYVHRFTKELHKGQPIDVAFEDFVKDDPMCLDSSDYVMQIERYLRFFPREQLLLLRQDELRSDPSALLERTQRFVGLPVVDLVKDGECVTNVGSTHLDSMARTHIAKSIKKLPGASVLAAVVPKGIKNWALDVLPRTRWGAPTAKLYQPPRMRPETRGKLIERYRSSLDRLEELMGEDLSGWRE